MLYNHPSHICCQPYYQRFGHIFVALTIHLAAVMLMGPRNTFLYCLYFILTQQGRRLQGSLRKLQKCSQVNNYWKVLPGPRPALKIPNNSDDISLSLYIVYAQWPTRRRGTWAIWGEGSCGQTIQLFLLTGSCTRSQYSEQRTYSGVRSE